MPESARQYKMDPLNQITNEAPPSCQARSRGFESRRSRHCHIFGGARQVKDPRVPEILEEYVSTFRDPVRVHGICEEYRAAAPAPIDVEHDRADKKASKRIECPMLHLWAEGGWLDTYYGKDGGPLGIRRQWAPHVQGQAIKGGHFFPEENPDDTAVLVKRFLSA
jgi:pimeloyl-ACP methyl ester carboxylesterase